MATSDQTSNKHPDFKLIVDDSAATSPIQNELPQDITPDMGYYDEEEDENYDDTSIFENKAGLSDDMRFLASMPELTDVTFLVGVNKEPVCGVKAILAARSKVFFKQFYGKYTTSKFSVGNVGGDASDYEDYFESSVTANHESSNGTNKRAGSKLKSLMKRGSDANINSLNSSSIMRAERHQIVLIDEFEPDVFRQLTEYAHTGCVTIQPRTLLGVMNAADFYAMDELKHACSDFVQYCVNVDTVCALLANAERYIQYKCTKNVVQRILEFVDDHGNEVLNLGSFALLPQHVVRLILGREDLKADEFSKFQAALMWSKKYCDSASNARLSDILSTFLEFIQFHMIPANILMKEIHTLGLVPYNTIMNALAYQADPKSVETFMNKEQGGVGLKKGNVDGVATNTLPVRQGTIHRRKTTCGTMSPNSEKLSPQNAASETVIVTANTGQNLMSHQLQGDGESRGSNSLKVLTSKNSEEESRSHEETSLGGQVRARSFTPGVTVPPPHCLKPFDVQDSSSKTRVTELLNVPRQTNSTVTNFTTTMPSTPVLSIHSPSSNSSRSETTDSLPGGTVTRIIHNSQTTASEPKTGEEATVVSNVESRQIADSSDEGQDIMTSFPSKAMCAPHNNKGQQMSTETDTETGDNTSTYSSCSYCSKSSCCCSCSQK